MKAVDPTIKIGALADVFEDGSANYSNHSAVNPRTGQTHYGWNPVMLSFLRDANCIPDFLIVHDYGPTAGDTQDLLYPRVWSSHAASLRQQLTDYLGAAGTNVTLEVTENGMGGDKQSVSLPGGLFYAESLGQIMQTEFNSRIWWDMHNGGGAIANPDPAMYGWRKDGNGNYISDGGIVNGDGVGTNGYPTYYVAKLLTRFAKGGDTVVSASSDYQLLTSYAVQRTNGTLTLLVINKSCVSNLTANFNLSGYAPATNATVYSYGIPQDEAARTGVGSMDVAQTNITGVQGNFSVTFAPFSASVLVLNPSGTVPPEMKALYAFEGNALDTSGSGNNGTPNAVSYVTGKVGSQAAQFNGTSSYVSIPRSIQDDFTVAMWVKTTDTAGSAGAQWWNGKGLVDGEVNGGGADWGTAIVNGKFVLGVGSTGGDTTIASSVNINDGTWHHVAATRDNTSGAMALYVDGVLRGSGTGPTGSRTFPPGLRIGSLQTGNNFLNGTLDDVRLYDRILTAGEITALATTPPAAPTGLAATAGNAQVSLSWNASATATNYFVKRSTTSGSGYVNIATNASLTFTNTGLVNGTTYYYVVSAVNAGGESTNSTQASATPVKSSAIVTLGNLSQTYDGTAKSATASTTPSGLAVDLTYDGSITAPTNAGSYTVIGTINDANYQGSATNTLVIMPAIPSAPVILTAVAGDAQVALTWTTVTNASSYLLKSSTTDGGPYFTRATVTGTSFTNTGLLNGTLYCFVVSATNSAGESVNSLQASARPISSVSTNLSVAINGNQLQLNWPADHTGWLLQAQTNSFAVGLGTNWSTVAEAGETNQITIGVGATNGAVFFRLVRP